MKVEFRVEGSNHLFLEVGTHENVAMLPRVGDEITTHLPGPTHVVTRVVWHYTPGGLTITVYLRPKSRVA